MRSDDGRRGAPELLALGFGLALMLVVSLLVSPAGERKSLTPEAQLDQMSTQEKVGQLLIVGFEGQRLDGAIRRAVAGRHAGGVILYKRNISDGRQLTELTSALQRLSVSTGSPGLLISADQEGGEVSHVTPAAKRPSQKELAGEGESAVSAAAAGTAEELRRLGINVNYAPVADVDRMEGRVLGSRAYSSDTAQVSRLVPVAIKAYATRGVAPVVKHFPGIGGAEVDPHEQMPAVHESKAGWEKADAPPFRAAIAAGAPMVMVSHIVYPALDADEPSITSERIQTGLLRGELRFRGVIITDDLEMGAATASVGAGRAEGGVESESEAQTEAGTEADRVADVALRAFLAGSDLLMVAHKDAAQEAAFERLLSAVNEGVISQDRLDASVLRVLKMKERMGLI